MTGAGCRGPAGEAKDSGPAGQRPAGGERRPDRADRKAKAPSGAKDERPAEQTKDGGSACPARPGF